MTRLPVRLERPPVKEAIVEFRFDTYSPFEVWFGLFFQKLGLGFKAPEQMAILELPQFVREQKKELQSKPHYMLRREDGAFVVQVGPKALLVASQGAYSGWARFEEEVSLALEALNGALEGDAAPQFGRVGVRYINFIPGDALPKTTIDVSAADYSLDATNVRLGIQDGPISLTLNASNAATVRVEGQPQQRGTTIDIDAYCLRGVPSVDLGSSVMEYVRAAHVSEKKLFFRLLGAELLESFGPTYMEGD